MNPTFNVPLNPLSFGQVSMALLKEAYVRGLAPCIFPIGNIDVGAYAHDEDFMLWIQSGINKSLKLHDRNTPTLKLWHINQSLESFSKDQYLLTFHEVDSITDFEQNILNNQAGVLVTSRFTKETFEEHGVKNVHYIDLGFDHVNFKYKEKCYDEPTIQFGVFGKLEPLRKAHEKIINGWIKEFGGQHGFKLNLAVYNPHFKREVNDKMLNDIFSKAGLDRVPWNVNIIPWMETNLEYNDFINNNDIVLSPFRSEGRDLPTFHSVGLGKHCVALNAHAYKDYLNNDNAVLIEPSSMIRAEDGMFFKNGSNFNQGNFFDWKDEDFTKALHEVVKRFNVNKINTAGLELQKITYNDTFSQILDVIN